ncbi:hypothetical protein GQ457_02G014960 [Hibiscus cannabinus]
MVMSSPNALEMIQGVGKEASRLKLDTEYGLQSSNPSNPAAEQIGTTKHGITKEPSSPSDDAIEDISIINSVGKSSSGSKIPGTNSK